MNKTITLSTAVLLLAACGGPLGQEENENVLTSKFKSTLNIYERVSRDGDGIITYKSVPWGGLVGSVKDHNLPVDWSAYEAITIDFATPTKVGTQLLVSDKYKAFGKPGITTLTCNFDGQDVTSIDEVTLQTSDSSVVKVKEVRLTPSTGVWRTIPLRTINCEFGDWERGFVIRPEKFAEARKGDKLEIIYTTDTSNPDVYNWLIKTVYNATDSTLEGNDNALNAWGCAPVGRRSTVYRIPLTAMDIVHLNEKGVFINGRYLKVTQINLLKQVSDL